MTQLEAIGAVHRAALSTYEKCLLASVVFYGESDGLTATWAGPTGHLAALSSMSVRKARGVLVKLGNDGLLSHDKTGAGIAIKVDLGLICGFEHAAPHAAWVCTSCRMGRHDVPHGGRARRRDSLSEDLHSRLLLGTTVSARAPAAPDNNSNNSAAAPVSPARNGGHEAQDDSAGQWKGGLLGDMKTPHGARGGAKTAGEGSAATRGRGNPRSWPSVANPDNPEQVALRRVMGAIKSRLPPARAQAHERGRGGGRLFNDAERNAMRRFVSDTLAADVFEAAVTDLERHTQPAFNVGNVLGWALDEATKAKTTHETTTTRDEREAQEREAKRLAWENGG